MVDVEGQEPLKGSNRYLAGNTAELLVFFLEMPELAPAAYMTA